MVAEQLSTFWDSFSNHMAEPGEQTVIGSFPIEIRRKDDYAVKTRLEGDACDCDGLTQAWRACSGEQGEIGVLISISCSSPE